MLTIIVPGQELFNEQTQEFSTTDDVVLELEHSLVSMSKWESKFQKPFLSTDDKSQEQVLGYIEAMILNRSYPKDVLTRFTQSNWDEVNAYMESSQSATTFGNMPEHKGRGETVTSELIYYWLVAFNIPFECELWHLNRLFSLIRICNLKNGKQRKMSKSEIVERNRALNAQRKLQHGTSG
jgi:hypothetical protein